VHAVPRGLRKGGQAHANERWDTDLLDELSTAMADASICGLGQAAPNPIRSVMKHFPRDIS
jgi:formate dehydrogenase beta subunit